MANIRNLAFGGGGAAGALAYPAAVKTLRKHLGGFDKIKRIAGASVGGITALMLALKYSDEEIENFLKNFNLKEIADGGWAHQKIKRLLKGEGIHLGKKL